MAPEERVQCICLVVYLLSVGSGTLSNPELSWLYSTISWRPTWLLFGEKKKTPFAHHYGI
ncbi:MAG: hypothetical protein Q9212_002470 [Teloschistes hypoglaucus]